MRLASIEVQLQENLSDHTSILFLNDFGLLRNNRDRNRALLRISASATVARRCPLYWAFCFRYSIILAGSQHLASLGIYCNGWLYRKFGAVHGLFCNYLVSDAGAWCRMDCEPQWTSLDWIDESRQPLRYSLGFPMDSAWPGTNMGKCRDTVPAQKIAACVLPVKIPASRWLLHTDYGLQSIIEASSTPNSIQFPQDSINLTSVTHQEIRRQFPQKT